MDIYQSQGKMAQFNPNDFSRFSNFDKKTHVDEVDEFVSRTMSIRVKIQKAGYRV
jgi:hypothetical protein